MSCTDLAGPGSKGVDRGRHPRMDRGASGIRFGRTAPAAELMSGEQDRSRAGEGVEDQIAYLREFFDAPPHHGERFLSRVPDLWFSAVADRAMPTAIVDLRRSLKRRPGEFAIGEREARQSVLLPPHEPTARRREEVCEVVAAPDDLLLAHAQHLAKVLGRRDRRIPVFRFEPGIAERAALRDPDPVRRIGAEEIGAFVGQRFEDR